MIQNLNEDSTLFNWSELKGNEAKWRLFNKTRISLLLSMENKQHDLMK